MLSSIPTTLLALASVATAALVPTAEIQQRSFEYVIKPKVFIISLFRPEAEIWHGIPEFDILAMNITVPGFSVLVSAWEEW
jgi:purine nucleoside permease